MGNMENIKKDNLYPEGLSIEEKLEAKLLKMNAEIKELKDKNKGLEVNKIESEVKIKKLEEENKEFEVKTEELEKKIENRDKLQKIMVHDLKNPINSIIGFAGILYEGVKNKEERLSNEKIIYFSEIIYNQGKKIDTLVSDLSAWISIQKNTMKPEILIINLKKEVDNVINLLSQEAEKKDISLKSEINSDEILADSNMLQTIIRNLTSNAIKFTNKGGHILISSEKKGNLIEISVADDGVGLGGDLKERIFKDVINSTDGTNGESGTGLGLSFCKELVEKMNGTIRVESEGKNKGTKFIITLPAGEEVKKEQ